MARKKSTTNKKSKSRETLGADPLTTAFPAPPAGDEEEKLSVDIPTGLGWRIKLALIALESRGEKTAKKKFVEEAIVAALDRLDHEWGGADG